MDLFNVIKNLVPFTTARVYEDRVLIRNCVDGKFYEVEEISGAIRDGKGVIIIDIKSEE